ncbi:MAG: ABC transporter permease [Candidatus Bathyarchaeota archaeon]|nr:ABC transporter permease [Candidatus Bathyarchaeota archaeon]
MGDSKSECRLREVQCPYGFNWSNLKAELRAVWDCNVKGWKLDFAYPINFVRKLLYPVVFMLPYFLYGLVLVGGRYSENLQMLVGTGDVVGFIFTGYILMGFIGTALLAIGSNMRNEQWFGTVSGVYVMPASRLGQVLGMALHSTIQNCFCTLIQFLFVYTFFGLVLNIEGILPALGIFALMMFALYGFGIVVSVLSLLLKEGWVVYEIIYSLMAVLSPVAYPLTVLPTLAQQASSVFPTVPAMIGLRTFLLVDYRPEVVSNVFLHLLALAALWILFGVLLFNLMDRYVRKRGLLEKF